MSNSLNSYTLLIQNNTTKQVWQFTLHNLSSNSFYYDFDFEMPDDATSGEYNYWLFWNTYDDYELDISNDVINSTIKFKNKELKVKDVIPETGIIKYIKNAKTRDEISYNKKTDFLTYDAI